MTCKKAPIVKACNLLSLSPILILALFLAAGCSKEDNQNINNSEKAISVRAQIVDYDSRELKKSFTGTLEGEKQAVIIARLAEAVEEVTIEEGREVRAGQVLIKLDRTGPSSNYVQAQSVYENAEKMYQKMKFLFDEGAVSETRFDEAQTQYEVARANFDAARQLVDIISPIKGVVTFLDVAPGDNLYAGKHVATVASIDSLRMKLGVAGTDIQFFKIGEEVEIKTESASDSNSKGRVITVAESADPVTRTFQVEIAIDNKSHKLKPGMFARADVIMERIDKAVFIPRSAALERDNENIVFTVSEGKAVGRKVTLGLEFNGIVEVKEGLSPQDTIVIVGQDYLDDGYPVKLVGLLDAAGEEIEF